MTTGQLVGATYAQKTNPLVAADKFPIIDSQNTAMGSNGSNAWVTMAAISAAVNSAQVCLNDYGPDKTGAAYSDTAMASAITALTALGGGVITCEAGTYKFASSYSFGTGYGINTGVPNASVTFAYTGTGVFLYSGNASFATSNTSPLVSVCGPMMGFTIDGTSAGSSAVGIQLGDQNLINVNIGVQNFLGSTAIGCWVASKVGWINYGSVTVSSIACSNHVTFDGINVAGGTALGGVNWTFYQTVSANQNGITARNVCQTVGGTFNVFGEYLGGSGTNSGSVFWIGATSSSSTAATVASGTDSSAFINFSSFNVNAESNTGAGNVGHTTVKLGAGGGFYANSGQLVFRNPFSATFTASTGLSTSSYFSFKGFALCQTSGDFLGNPYASVGVVGWADASIGGAIEKPGTVSGTYIYAFSGSVFDVTLASGTNTLTLYGTAAGYAQKLKLFVAQPASGAAGTLTITGVKTVNGTGAFTLSATNGYIDEIDLVSDGTNIYGAVVALHLH